MNNKIIAMITGVLAMTAAQACSSTDTSGAGGSGSTTSSSDTSSSTASSASASSGAATGCMFTVPTSPPACPDTTTAEGAYSSMQSACGLTKEDLDASDPKSPTLTAVGKGKMCATCECQKKAFDYYGVYANCTDGSDAANTAFSKSIHSVVLACPQ
jgi:hypothetical protein